MNIEYRVCGYLVHRCYKHVKGNIFDGLDVKNNKDLSKQALEGIKINETDDYYEAIHNTFPESSDAVQERIVKVAEHYRGKHAENKGKSIFYIVASHREVMTSLPKEFNCGTDQSSENVMRL